MTLCSEAAQAGSGPHRVGDQTHFLWVLFTLDVIAHKALNIFIVVLSRLVVLPHRP